ncbi:MAG: M1 family metallopeptidase [Candidatus Saccharibacteria bacterium]|nr:M1 family metallopeptidase [Candidatus Saccharibacteria bacterium]
MERFFDYFKPEHYDLDFTISADKTRLVGIAKIKGEAKAEKIKLHAEKLRIKEFKLSGKESEYVRENGAIIIDGLKKSQKVTLEFTYSAPIEADMEGVYLSTYEFGDKTEKIVTTQFESHYARQCFPCVDEPSAKATFNLTLRSEIPTDIMLGNMPVKEEQLEPDMKTVVFEETPKMSTYLLAFAVGNFIGYQTVSKHGVTITAYAGLHQKVEDLKYAGDFAADVLDFYDDCFKTPFPLPKMDLLALPDFEAGAMENWGLVTFREIAMLANENSAIDQKQYVAIVVAHELSHMWFGDLVTMKWWDDLWLNESFANMMEVYSTDKIRPELSAWDDFYTSAILGAFHRDCLPGVQPVKVEVKNVEEIANLFDGAIVYGKGSRLMMMLMRTMGEENFFNGLKDYFEKHKYGNTEADDLWNALSPYADFDVKEFMTPWLVQSGYPVITDGEQERFLISGEQTDEKYPIHDIKDDLTGNYLLNLSDDELEDKLAQLKKLNKEQKLRLLIDRRLLAKTDRVASASLLTLIEAFADETDPVIWELVSSIVADLKVFFTPESKEEKKYKEFVRRLALPNYERLGIEQGKKDSDNDIKLRPIIMGMMHYADDEDYLEAIDETYNNIYITKIDQNLRYIIACSLVRIHPELSMKYFGIYQSTPDSALKRDLMDALTGVRNKEVALSYLDRLMDGTVRAQDRLIFYMRLLRNYRIREEAFDWVYKNWDWLRKEEGDKTISEYPRYMAAFIRTIGDANNFENFFGQYEKEKILERDIAVAYAEIDARLKLIKDDRKAIYEFLG